MYQGYDVLEIEPNATTDQAEGVSPLYADFDPQTGRRSLTLRSDAMTAVADGFRVTLGGLGEINAFRAFVEARKGACVPFWVPTWRRDAVVSSDISGATLQIRYMGYTRNMFPSPARRHVAIILLDGTGRRFYRKVAGAGEAGRDESITLDAAVGGDGEVIPSGMAMLSFLRLVRLAGDEVEMTFHTPCVAEATLGFSEVPQEVPE
jgi:hypothetical protein